MFASANYEVITNKEKSSKRIEGGGGGGTAVYYRALPNGDWKEAYAGNGFPECKSLSEETKKVFSALRKNDEKSMISCWDQNVNENLVSLKFNPSYRYKKIGNSANLFISIPKIIIERLARKIETLRGVL